MTLLLGPLLIMLGAAHSAPREPAPSNEEETVCPADDARARNRVLRVMQSSAAQPIRERDGWAGVNPANLQVLTDAADSAVRRWLTENVRFDTPYRVTSYYRADGFYFVGTEKLRVTPAGSVLLGGWEPVIVFRSDLTLVGSYAS